MTFAALLAEVRACTFCADRLALGPRPIVQAASTARLLIVGQAPGRRVHLSGVPWDDDSGMRLRDWLGIAPAIFYDPARVALMPMGLCYPGTAGGADLPPCAECAPRWHPRLLAAMPCVMLTLLIGGFAQTRYWTRTSGKLTERVAAWRDAPPGVLALPHPSWRVVGWMKRQPWFETELLPELRCKVAAAVA